jgi:hypothetical protein
MKDRKVKWIPSGVGSSGSGEYIRKRVKEGKYGGCILCSCMKVE